MLQQTPKLDRDSARALVDAGFMPLEDYVAMFEDDGPQAMAATQTAPKAEPPVIGSHRSRPWSIPAHFAAPFRIAIRRPGRARVCQPVRPFAFA